jgi:hypothetical protein
MIEIIIIMVLWVLIGGLGAFLILIIPEMSISDYSVTIMREDKFDDFDYVFIIIMSVSGLVILVIALIFLIVKLIIYVKNKEKKILTLKQERLRKLKNLKRFSWFRR